MGKLSLKRIKELQKQISSDSDKPNKPSEKPLKLNTSFENAIKQLSKNPHNKK